MYEIKLADFQGPLDLLIHLIEKDKIDIYDIPIASVTEQYIAYLNAMQEYDLDVASEFLLMAALLLQIKSRMLLPRDPEEDEEEEADPRQMLVDMLVEYQKTKRQAAALRECLQEASLQMARRPLPLTKKYMKVKRYALADLLRALTNLLPARPEEEPVIPRQEFPVQEKMEAIREQLAGRTKPLAFRKLIRNPRSYSETISVFLAVLELLRLKEIGLVQEAPFAPMYLTSKEERHHGTDENR
ncbi:segregation and condensation protein A [Acidaminococcus timonensis]|uniref:segregation and condensation protein A n=1 Tax=Acidaminococcus timonensis TaxID=1871002 RepID=UPI003079E164